MTEQFVSRRQLRESRGQAQTSGDFAVSPVEELSSEHIVPSVQITPVAPAISTTGVLNPYAPKLEARSIISPEVTEVVDEAVQLPLPSSSKPPAPNSENTNITFEPVLAESEEAITSQFPVFATSPNLSIEPQTASIIIDNFQPLDSVSIVISETGELLKTGSIQLPNLSTHTGEIATILDAEAVDEAIAQDSVAGYVSTIAPLRASGVVNSSGKIGILPTKGARGRAGGLVALTISILSITIGGLVLALFMLGILR